MKLRTQLYTGTLVAFGILIAGLAAITLYWFKNATIKRARSRVERSINSAWLIYNGRVEEIRLLTESLAATTATDLEVQRSGSLREKLETFRKKNNLDIVDLVDRRGHVIIRSRVLDGYGDSLKDNIIVEKALSSQKPVSGTMLLTGAQLRKEGQDLVAKCEKCGGEPTGMFRGVGVPIMVKGECEGILLAGSLLNGSVETVDKIRDLIFEGKLYKGKPVGTATIFMKDLRISTNVVNKEGERAIGTRVSNEVAQRVLKRGLSWTGRAWVVDTWYISQYDPIKDPENGIIGMLYIGELEQRYFDTASRELILELAVVFTVMILMFLVMFPVTSSIVRSIEKLSQGTERLTAGDFSYRVNVERKDELGRLCGSFNNMAEKLEKQRSEIEQRQKALEEINEEVKRANRNYMEMLGFVSHELRNPLASATMALYTVKDEYVGKLNSAQKKSLALVAQSLNYFEDMIKNYLDLSRLEKGEMIVNKSRFKLLAEVVKPVVDSFEAELQQKKLVVENHIPEEAELNADKNLLRIVYDNLFSNAIKYGKESGKVELYYIENEGGVILGVRNEGQGIAKDKLPMLFQKFSRLDDLKYRTRKGTGLGLYICKEIIEKHRGKIWAESEEGKWVKFMFRLPLD